MEHLQMLLQSLSHTEINIFNQQLTEITDPKVAFCLKAPQHWKVSSKFTERPLEIYIRYQSFHRIITTLQLTQLLTSARLTLWATPSNKVTESSIVR